MVVGLLNMDDRNHNHLISFDSVDEEVWERLEQEPAHTTFVCLPRFGKSLQLPYRAAQLHSEGGNGRRVPVGKRNRGPACLPLCRSE
jgi:hypothetical protein